MTCPADCSNAGDCDTSTGKCSCHIGRHGADCSSKKYSFTKTKDKSFVNINIFQELNELIFTNNVKSVDQKFEAKMKWVWCTQIQLQLKNFKKPQKNKTEKSFSLIGCAKSDKWIVLPLHVPDSLSNPWKQTQVPVVSSHVPWFEQVPSPGQSNSVDVNQRC